MNDGSLLQDESVGHENQRHHWSLGDKIFLIERAEAGKPWAVVAEKLGRTPEGCKQKFIGLCDGEDIDDLPPATSALLEKYKKTTAYPSEKKKHGDHPQTIEQCKALCSKLLTMQGDIITTRQIKEIELAAKIRDGELLPHHLPLAGIKPDACQRIIKLAEDMGIVGLPPDAPPDRTEHVNPEHELNG